MTRTRVKDICTTCNDGNVCRIPVVSVSGVWHCEQFDNHTPSPAGSRAVTVVTAGSDTGNYGLYGERYRRETCNNSKTEGGIWHCEEYR